MKTDFIRGVRSWQVFALVLLALPFASVVQAATGVGFLSIKIHDPVNGGTMPGYVFYPAAHAKGASKIRIFLKAGAPA